MSIVIYCTYYTASCCVGHSLVLHISFVCLRSRVHRTHHQKNGNTRTEKDPYPVEALPTCNHALSVCQQERKCIKLFENFKTHCKVRDNKCRMDDRWASHGAQRTQEFLFLIWFVACVSVYVCVWSRAHLYKIHFSVSLADSGVWLLVCVCVCVCRQHFTLCGVSYIYLLHVCWFKYSSEIVRDAVFLEWQIRQRKGHPFRVCADIYSETHAYNTICSAWHDCTNTWA